MERPGGFLEAVGGKNWSEATRLRAMSTHDPRGCSKALAHAIALRDSLRKVLSAIEAKKRIPPERIVAINAVLRAHEGYE